MYYKNKQITIEVTNKCAAKCIMCPREKMIQPLEVMSQELYEKIMDYFLPYREKRRLLLSKPDDIIDIISMGAKKAKVVASEVLERIKTVIGLNYRL